MQWIHQVSTMFHDVPEICLHDLLYRWRSKAPQSLYSNQIWPKITPCIIPHMIPYLIPMYCIYVYIYIHITIWTMPHIYICLYYWFHVCIYICIWYHTNYFTNYTTSILTATPSLPSKTQGVYPFGRVSLRDAGDPAVLMPQRLGYGPRGRPRTGGGRVYGAVEMEIWIVHWHI
jgi:hypothetical protein